MLTSSPQFILDDQQNLVGTTSAFIETTTKFPVPHFTKQIESIGLGIGTIMLGAGAIFGAVFGLPKVGLKSKLNKKTSDYREKYPLDKLNQENGFKIVNIPGDNKWWLIDGATDKRHWLKNPQTTEDLNLRGLTPDNITKKELDEHKPGEIINTRKL